MTAEPDIRVPRIPTQQAAAPDDTCMIRLEVTQLRAYDRNPRRCQNSEYKQTDQGLYPCSGAGPAIGGDMPARRDGLHVAGRG